MFQKRIAIWRKSLYKHVSLGRFLYWQSRFLTEEGRRSLTAKLMAREVERVTFVRNGIHWTTYARDVSVGMHLFYHDGFDRTIVEYVLAWLKSHNVRTQANTILEVGANLGSTTIPLALNSACRIVSIEPVPRNLLLLRQNLTQNGFADRVHIVERAITDTAGTVEMLIPLYALGGSEIMQEVAERPEHIFRHPTETIRVQTTRLDTLLYDLNLSPQHVALVWCDVQGSEGAVVRTGAPLWENGVPLWAEIAPQLLSRQGDLEKFVGEMTHRFASFLTRPELNLHELQTKPRSIDEFPALVARLGNTQMDVLFLPPASH